jgi:predicted phage tail protein
LKYRADFSKNISHKEKEIHIISIPMGAGGGGFFGSLLQIVMGAALIIGGALLLGTPFAAFSLPMIIGGLGLLATGVLGLLTPMPKFDYDDKDFRQSYAFGTVPNTVRQGDPIPLLYGETIIPGLLVETKLESTDA